MLGFFYALRGLTLQAGSSLKSSTGAFLNTQPSYGLHRELSKMLGFFYALRGLTLQAGLSLNLS